MSRKQKQSLGSLAVIIGLICLSIIGLLLTRGRAGEGDDVHRFTLVARDMAFYRPDKPNTPNPPIKLPNGKTVAITLRNEDAGVRHDVAVKLGEQDWTSEPIMGGETTVLRFTVPDGPPGKSYRCTFHPVTMRGELRLKANEISARRDRPAPTDQTDQAYFDGWEFKVQSNDHAVGVRSGRVEPMNSGWLTDPNMR